jgi:hypothetical protein
MKGYVKYFIIIFFSILTGWFSHSIWERYRYDIFKPPFFDSYESFDYFYLFYSKDSIYQKEHTRFPLIYKIWIAEHGELYKEEQWKEWKYIHVPKELQTLLYDNFEGEMNGGRRLLQHNNIFYYFEFQQDTWYLIKIDEYI